jgi:putative oxidoreductase
MKDIIDLLGRLFLAAVFFFEGIDTTISRTHTYKIMTFYGFTWQQDFLYQSAIFVLLLGATLIALGYRVGLGTILVLCFWIPVTFTVYSFWTADAAHRDYELMMFIKNLSIMGGLLILAAHGAGKYSIKRLLATTRV